MRALLASLWLLTACSAPPASGLQVSAGKVLFVEGAGKFAEGDSLRGSLTLVKVVEKHPESYWARRAVETLWERRREVAAAGFSLPELLGGLYEEHKETSIAGHLLFYDALWFARPGVGMEREAIYLLLVLIDHHPASSLWDDGVWLAADMLHRLGVRGTKRRFWKPLCCRPLAAE